MCTPFVGVVWTCALGVSEGVFVRQWVCAVKSDERRRGYNTRGSLGGLTSERDWLQEGREVKK